MGVENISSEILKDFLDLCGNKLIHITNYDFTGDLMPSGSVNRPASSHDRLAPRPGCVYLSCPGSSSRRIGRYYLVIDAKALEPDLFRVDEDNYINAIATQKPPYAPGQEIPDAIVQRARNFLEYLLGNGPKYDPNWFNEISPELDTPKQILRSLADGSCAYQGVIPKDAILQRIDTHEDPTALNTLGSKFEFSEKSENLAEKYGWATHPITNR